MQRIYFPKFVPPWLANAIKRLRVVQALDNLLLSQDMMMRALTTYHLEKEKPDLIIRPAVAHLNTLETVIVHDVIRRGEEAVDASLPALECLFSSNPHWGSKAI
jgi:hypothetical protein